MSKESKVRTYLKLEDCLKEEEFPLIKESIKIVKGDLLVSMSERELRTLERFRK